MVPYQTNAAVGTEFLDTTIFGSGIRGVITAGQAQRHYNNT